MSGPAGRLRQLLKDVALTATAVAVICTAPAPVAAAPVAVRFSEGIVRGFLELNDMGGKRIASGDFLQSPGEGEVKCRTLLRFKDGSVHDETAVFTQKGSLALKSYSLVQKGKSFKTQLIASLERGGAYRVEVQEKGERQRVLKGTLDLPSDVYNGVIPIVMKNLAKGSREKVHLVAFTPAPRVIELEMNPLGDETMLVGDLEKKAAHYVLKPKLGILRLPATLLGRNPPDNHIWTVMDEVPAFVKFTGPLAIGGPIWSIHLASPRWPK